MSDQAADNERLPTSCCSASFWACLKGNTTHSRTLSGTGRQTLPADSPTVPLWSKRTDTHTLTWIIRLAFPSLLQPPQQNVSSQEQCGVTLPPHIGQSASAAALGVCGGSFSNCCLHCCLILGPWWFWPWAYKGLDGTNRLKVQSMCTEKDCQTETLKKPGNQCRIKNSFPQQYAAKIAPNPREL